ncbi:MAG: nucleotidyltransferase [Tannerellaceae bacterium]|jgi:choline kinase|nr:nucleotidyltransferase [Tannerellaceae bacterium]
MEKPVLLILAAGMGSRYGALKQLDGLGPSGETVMDYSVYDALQAGFGRVVFVIRNSFAENFRCQIVSKYEKYLPVELVFQELDSLPDGFRLPIGRVKPWGTNHAILMAKEIIHSPFAAINADDFYGRDSFALLATQLKDSTLRETGNYCMVAYKLSHTLSEHGAVSRGICKVSPDGYLTAIVERTAIDHIEIEERETPVSMNMWGFTPDYLLHSERYFIDFLQAHHLDLKSEYFIPTMVNHLLETRQARVKVLDTPSQWFGVTYPDDRPAVVEKLRALVDVGLYPSPLFP